MSEHRTNRRLAAILAADVVGYSRLMEADEAGTLAALKRHRENVFDPAVAKHNGRIVKLIGDGALTEFGSVIDAVNCAVEVQSSVPAEQDDKTSRSAIVLRIGINLGDVIIDGEDIYGDGVNVAARLEALAAPGGVCVSSVVHESIGTRVDIRFQDGGSIHVKNIDRPVRVWRWHPGNKAAETDRPIPSDAKPPVQKSSIAILPFTNMSGDPDQEYFSDGISEDIITDLSKIAGLMVIARNSSFTYKGRSVDIRAVGRDLGVRSVLEGSVRRAGNRVRITAQLIDATTGGHLWAERFDRDLSDLFAVQDDVTSRIVQALKVTLSPTEKARLANAGTSNIDAHDSFLRARPLFMGVLNSQAFEKVTKLLMKAIELDPNYSQAYAGLGFAHMYDYQNHWSPNSERALILAKQSVDRAIEKDPDEPLARVIASLTATFEKDFVRAEAEANRALSLNPNSAEAYGCLGNIYVFSGKPLEAIPMLELAMRLDPAYTQQFLHLLGIANLLVGRYETAVTVLRQRVLLVPGTDFSRAILVSALGYVGDLDEARRVWHELKKINPRYSFQEHFERLPFTSEDDVRRIAAGLAKAGISD
ncbi:MAG: guanylyl cyclase [Alphaproteobacteria bacterium]|nr:MAG: guanylyl cyclase [Alphaproteobacteria bacterium]